MSKKRNDMWREDEFIDIRSHSDSGIPPDSSPRPVRTGAGSGRQAPAARSGRPPRQRAIRPQPDAGDNKVRYIEDYEKYRKPQKRSPGGPEARRSPPSKRPVQQKTAKKKPNRLIAAMAIITMAVITFLLCVFLLFKVTEITVTGDIVYESSQILELCGYENGDNLFFVSTSDKEKLLKEKLPYIADVKIHRRMPGTLEIEIRGATVSACVENGGMWLYVSAGGKILEVKGEPKPGVMQVVGLTSTNSEMGQLVSTEEEGVLAAYQAVVDTLTQLDVVQSFTKLDLSDIYDIRLFYEDRVEFKLGSSAELAYKVEFGCSIVTDVNKIGAAERGSLDLSNAEDIKRATFAVDTGQSPQSPSSGSTPGDSSGDDTSDDDSSDDNIPDEGSQGRGEGIPTQPFLG